MKNRKIKTKVIHSQSKNAYNVVSETLGTTYKVARCPYVVVDNVDIDTTLINMKNRLEAFDNAVFISFCFNHFDDICNDG
jgi:hypothetical protein